MSLNQIKFSRPDVVPTRYGVKYMRKWVIPKGEVQDLFMTYWKENKNKMLSKGFTLTKDKKTNSWELQEWKDNPNEFKEYKKRPEIVMESNLSPKPLKDKSGLRPWQVPAAAQLAESIRVHGAALDGSDTGTGKTYAALAVARELGLKVAVVCPKSVIESWRRVIVNHFGLEYEFILNYEALKGDKNRHILDRQRRDRSLEEDYVWKIPANILIIFDESHRLKGQDTLNAEMAKAAKRQGYKILCCSATNAVNPLELNAVGYILGLHKSGLDFYKFLRRHDCDKGRYSWKFSGGDYILKKLHKDIFLDRGYRIVKNEIPDFPESEIITEPYTIDEEDAEEINKLYFTMHKELEELKKTTAGDTRGMEMTIRLRSRQKIELLKVPLLVEMAQDLLEEGNSVAIMVNFTETIKSLSQKLGTKCIVWGENKGTERDDNIDAFQADEERVILVNIAAGGVGVSLHDLHGNHPRVALISPNDSAPILRQSFGRVHRDGAKTKSQQRVIFIANTVEEDVCNNVKMKLNDLDMINDGDLDPNLQNVLRE